MADDLATNIAKADILARETALRDTLESERAVSAVEEVSEPEVAAVAEVAPVLSQQAQQRLNQSTDGIN